MEGISHHSGLELIHYCNPNYSMDILKAYNLTFSITSMVTFLFTTAILVAMLFYKAYHTILKRLFLYLTLSIMVYLANSSLNIQLWPSFFKRTGDTFCRWTGYIQSATYICTLILTLEISLYLLFVVYCQLREKPIPVPTRTQTVVLEVVCLVLAVVVPTCFLAIPFKHFGLAAAICWIQLYNDTQPDSANCTRLSKSITLGTSLFSVYSIIILTNLVAFVMLFMAFIRLACKYQQSRAQYMQTARRTIILFSFLIFYGVVHLASILIPYLMVEHELTWKYSVFIYCTLSPSSQFFRPLAYLFYLNSVKRFRWEETKVAAIEWRRSLKFFCYRCCRCARSQDTMLINDLDWRSGEYLTPSVTTSTHKYDSLGRTSVE